MIRHDHDRQGGDKMGYRVEEFRKRRGMTQEQLAEKSGISRQTINDIETDNEKTVKSSTLLKLAKALETTVQDLFLP